MSHFNFINVDVIMQTVFRLAFAGILMSAAACALAAPAYPAINLFGVAFSKDEPWYRECMRVEHVSGAEQPSASAQGPQSEAGELYYLKRSQAFTSAAEWNMVKDRALALGDNAVLMMLYANGYGVPRNTDIAIHYACSMDFVAKAEIEHRVAHLAEAPASKVPFDQCDDITSGMMGGVCAHIFESQARRVRDARLNRAALALPPDARAALRTVRAAADAYADAAWMEVDGHGTGAAGFATEHQGKLREQFMQAILDVLGNKLHAAPAATTAQLDAQLNATYQQLMHAPSTQQDQPDRIGESTISRNALRQVERLWIAYRDAFVAFNATLPAPSGSAPIAPLLTSQRIVELKRITPYL